MAPHSSTLAWKIPWTEEPGRLQSMVKSRARLSDFTFTFHFHALEKEMATHSSVLAWRIPGMGKPGGLPSVGLTESDTTEATQQQQLPQQSWLSAKERLSKGEFLDLLESSCGMIGLHSQGVPGQGVFKVWIRSLQKEWPILWPVP